MPPRLPRNVKLIITSQNGLRALTSFTDRRDWDVITVGDASANLARGMGFKNVTSAKGNADDLVVHVRQDYSSKNDTFAYLSGSKVRLDIADELSKLGYDAVRYVYYENTAVQNLPNVDLQKITHIALYSKLAASCLEKLNVDLAGKRPVSISAFVDAALDNQSLATRYIAKRPEESAMIAALSS